MRFNADLDAPIVARKYAPRNALPIPPGSALDAPLLTMTGNSKWFSHIIGIMEALDQPDAWEGTEAQVENARAEIRKLIANIDQEATVSMFPLGLVIPSVAMVASVPAWLLPCDGATYARDDYPDLYDVLEAAFIVNGTTFKTPDLNGRFPLGASAMIGSTGGAAEHQLTESEMPEHAHRRGNNDAWILEPNPLPPGLPQRAYAVSTTSGVFAYQKTNTEVAGGNEPHNNMPPYITARYFIVALQV